MFSEYKLVFGFLFIYGCYNISNLYKNNLLTKLNGIFYCIILSISIYGMFFAHQQPKYAKKIQKNQQIKKEKVIIENKVDIIKIPQEQHQKIFKKLSADYGFLQNQKYQIENIYKIQNLNVKKKFYEHQKLKEQKVKLIGSCGISNTNIGFHGTKKNCDRFDKICDNLTDCPFCNILLNGFKNSFSGKGMTTDLRYGKGTYFSPEMSKALAYCQTDVKVLLCCKIVMGRTFRPNDADHYSTYFDPDLYECVHADPGFTVDIKNPEICIKNENACLPRYILVIRSQK